MEATLAAARAGVTTGEWAGALREVFGSYRAPTGVGEAASPAADEALRDEVARVSEALGRTLKILVGKPGLDGHSNGAEQIAVRARDAGMDVVYEGIRLDAGADRPLGDRRGRARDRPLDPVRLAPRADPGRDRRARRRRHPGRRRRHHPRRRRARSCARRASPRSTRRRTSSSTGSCTRSWRWLPSATPSPLALGPGPRPTSRRRPRGEVGHAAGRSSARGSRRRPLRRAGRAEPARDAHRARAGGGARLRRRRRRRPRRRRHRAAGRRQVDAAVRARCASGASRGAPSPCSPSTRRPSAPAARCSATARGSSTTPPTATSSSARWPPASGSAASRRRPAPPRRRSRTRSTSS